MRKNKAISCFIVIFTFLFSFGSAQEKKTLEPLDTQELVLLGDSVNPEEAHVISTFLEEISNQGIERAVEYLENQCVEYPESSILCAYLGDVYRTMLEDNEKAWQQYQKAYQLNPNDITIKFAYGLGCNISQKYDEGFTVFEEICSQLKKYMPADGEQVDSLLEKQAIYYYRASISAMIEMGIAVNNLDLVEKILSEEIAQFYKDEDYFIRTSNDIYSVLEYCIELNNVDKSLKYAKMYIDLYNEACGISDLFDEVGKAWLTDIAIINIQQIERFIQNVPK